MPLPPLLVYMVINPNDHTPTIIDLTTDFIYAKMEPTLNNHTF